MSVKPLKILSACAVTAILSGCAANADRIALENRLRSQQSTIRSLESDLAKAEAVISDQDQELSVIRNTTTTKAGRVSVVSSSVETAAAWGSVVDLQIQTLTAGLIKQGEHQVVNLVVQPLDDEGELVKVAGHLETRAATIDEDGTSHVIAQREIDLTESRTLWARGLVSSGFHVQMDIDSGPVDSDKLLLTAVLDLGHGRQYSATELIDVQ